MMRSPLWRPPTCRVRVCLRRWQGSHHRTGRNIRSHERILTDGKVILSWPRLGTGSPCACRDAWRGLPPRAPGDFFGSIRRFRVPGVAPRPRRELAEAKRPEVPAHRRLAHRYPQLLPEPLRQVDPPPAHHPIAPRLGTSLHPPRQPRPLLRRQGRHLAGRLPVDQSRRTFRVEPQHPVPHDLQPDPADPRRIGRNPLLKATDQAALSPPRSEPANSQAFLPRATPRSVRSAAVLVRQVFPYARKPANPSQRRSM